MVLGQTMLSTISICSSGMLRSSKMPACLASFRNTTFSFSTRVVTVNRDTKPGFYPILVGMGITLKNMAKALFGSIVAPHELRVAEENAALRVKVRRLEEELAALREERLEHGVPSQLLFLPGAVRLAAEPHGADDLAGVLCHGGAPAGVGGREGQVIVTE